ncbi:MAG TPA: ubiquinol-cytochrome c reductase iron-sulfur subunit [Steroidobacteraceae bacterium]|jgi:ubiquinol-cytochrome c reductase iron-sulfur subunit
MSEVGALTDHPQPEIDEGRRKFLTVATGVTAAVGAVVAAVPFVASWTPSERARALGAPVEVDLSKLQTGQMITPTWRLKPIYIVRRDQAMVDKLPQNDGRLKDPKSHSSTQPDYARNEMRSRRADLLVLIGICTHLGCLPKQFFDAGDPVLGADWPGGFRCPCHGSRFDLAGRVFDGSPASTNLVVPPYSFRDQNTLIIGLDSPQPKGAS